LIANEYTRTVAGRKLFCGFFAVLAEAAAWWEELESMIAAT
jgi:hypothetical protein